MAGRMQRFFTNRQNIAIAGAAGNIGRDLLRRTFERQNASQGRGGARQQRTANIPRPRFHSMRDLGNMPSARLHSRDQFENNSTKDMMKAAWAGTPAGSNMMAPRGLGYYDAFESQPASAMTHASIGPCTPVVGKTTCGGGAGGAAGAIDTKNGTGYAQLLIVAPAASSTQAVLYSFNGTNPQSMTNTVDVHSFNCPQLGGDSAEAGASGLPQEVIPSRCSMRLRNYSSHVNQGGLVRVLRMTTGFVLDPDYTTNAQFLDLMQGIREHRRTRTYGGTELQSDMQKNCIVADQSRSLAFQTFEELVPNNLLPWLPALPPKSVHPWERNLFDPTFTPIAILFEPFTTANPSGTPVGNEYQVTVQTQFLAHYKQGTMLANLSVSPSSDPNKLNAHRDHEEAKGSNLESILNGIGSVGKFAYNHMGDIRTLGQGLAPLMGIGGRAVPMIL